MKRVGVGNFGCQVQNMERKLVREYDGRPRAAENDFAGKDFRRHRDINILAAL